MTGRLASFTDMARDELAPIASRRHFLPDGRAPKPGAGSSTRIWREHSRRSPTTGWSGFYEGPVAKEMARFAQSRAVSSAQSDFGRQKATWGEPLIGRYRDVTIYNTPPPTQGFTVSRCSI